MRRRVTVLALVVVIGLPAVGTAAGGDGIEFFEKKIRPVLVEHCYKCHSAAAKKDRGGLALDTKAGVLKGGDTGPLLVPGKPADSLLLKAIHYTDPDLRMPPKGKLPASVIADLARWVAMGTPDPRTIAVARTKGQESWEAKKSWAFYPPRRHPVPAVKDAAWPRAPLDRFLLSKLEEKGLMAAPPADRRTLLRRANFDLLGLPPTPHEVDDFLGDTSPQAFAKVVDRLLASPHFGERWGRHWLDVARFAESSGGGRSLLFKDAWRYRDYVIRAFNNDRPYDVFIKEQIAGDLLPATTPEQRRELLIATAFLLLGPTNYERQDKPILEMDVIDEQLDTLGKAFLGMTIGCARCHDHKFDAIPTKDYYALAGILKSTKAMVHANVSRWMEQPLPMTAVQEQAVRQHDKVVAALKERIRLAKLADQKAGKEVGPVFAKGAVAASTLPGIVVDDTQAKRVGPWKASKFTGSYIGDGYLYDDRSVKGEKTLTFVPEFSKGGFYEVRLAYVAHVNRATNVPVRVFHADGEETVRVNQRQAPPIDGRFLSLGRYRFEPGSQWFVMLSTAGTNGHVVADAVQFLPDEARRAAVKPPAPPTPGAKGKRPAADWRALEAELKRLVASGPPRPMAMAVAEGEKVEDCHICVRGNYHNRGPKVPRGFLQALTPAGAPFTIPAHESGRRQLADWLASPDNPLTARVMVNRIWHHLFGAGLVRTVDNFGNTGEAPSHPELLDHLALRFVEQGWSVKKMIREIMLSRAYQLSSASPSPAAVVHKIDPENRLLSRMNRRRLDAESLRDAMLLVSGGLDRTAGGPTIRTGTTAERDYRFEDTRRSVYTPIFRNHLLELFEAFDFPDPNVCLGRRNVSTVSTQALFLMNSPFVMEQARRAAGSLLMVPKLDDVGRVELAYRRALGRLPGTRERTLALAFVGQAPGPRVATWGQLYQTLFACIDFRYVD